MIKWKTKYTNNMGEDTKYPIYLIVYENGTYDLQCDLEIYAMAWYTIYEESVKEYEESVKK